MCCGTPVKRLLVYLGLFLAMSVFGRLAFLGRENAGGWKGEF